MLAVIGKDSTEITPFCNPLNVRVTSRNFNRFNCLMASRENDFTVVFMEMGYIGNYTVTSNGKPVKNWEYFLSEPRYVASPVSVGNRANIGEVFTMSK